MNCIACLKQTKADELIACVLCKGTYHFRCLNMSAAYYMENNHDLMRRWKCPTCSNNINSQRRGKTDDTPTKGVFQCSPPTAQVGTEEMSFEEDDSHTLKSSCYGSTESSKLIGLEQFAILLDTRLDFKLNAIKSTLAQEIAHELKVGIDELKNDFSAATLRLSSQVSEMRRELDTLGTTVKQLQDENSQLRSEITSIKTSGMPSDTSLSEAIAQLKADLNERDQVDLINDIELNNIPESEGESTVHIAMSVGTKLGLTIEERDIVSAVRVGPKRSNVSSLSAPMYGPRPRPIVVRLARRTIRDDLLHSARVRRGATTAGLGLADDVDNRIFYVNQRLTKSNRIIFGKARAAGRTHQWRFVWVKEGRVYAKRTDSPDCPVHLLRSEQHIERVFGKKSNSN